MMTPTAATMIPMRYVENGAACELLSITAGAVEELVVSPVHVSPQHTVGHVDRTKVLST